MNSIRMWGLIFGAVGFGGLALMKIFDMRSGKGFSRRREDCIHGIEHGLQFRCSGIWFQQAWTFSKDPEICMDMQGRRYSANESKVTCEKCKNSLST